MVNLEQSVYEVRYEKGNIFKNDFKREEKKESFLPILNPYKPAVYSNKEYIGYNVKNLNINASIPEYNLKETQATNEIKNYISELDKKMNETIKVGDEKRPKENIVFAYTASEHEKYLSLALNYIEENGNKVLKTFVYDYSKKKNISLEDYLLEKAGESNKIKREVERIMKNKGHKPINIENFFVDEKGDVIIFIDENTYIYVHEL